MSGVGHWSELNLAGGGRSLIEASAGTGKTWTISILYLRLLLEQQLGPAQIVVTTFTDAAAQELRERVRARIAWALQLGEHKVAAAGADGEDLRWLRARWDGAAGTAAARADLNLLRLAQAELDRAPIGTLHSLCRRILADHPFESGSTFEFGEPVAPDAIQAELIDDLWRQLSQSTGTLSDDDETWRKAGRPKLERYLRLVLAPGVGVATIDPGPIEAIMRKANAQMMQAWLESAQFVRSTSKLRTRLFALAQYIADDGNGCEWPTDLAEVLDEPLDKHLRSTTADAATRRVLDFARRAADVLAARADVPRARALARYCTALRARCRERLAASGRMTFDELIERVAGALTGAGGAALADRLFAAWPVALVDEFQDTDLQQYAILDRIYRETAGGPLRGRLVMIGDPKQAIYRFRGGDIDAYLEAAATTDSTLELATNFRSSRQFVQALNALYQHAGPALSSDPGHPVRYLPVSASGKLDTTPYCIDGVICERPLQFHYWDGAVPEAAEERVGAALEACAKQVVELLSGRHTIGADSVQPGNIAVLLPTRAQVLELRNKLRDRDVPCVTSAWSSVFDSPWARELRIVLYAALHPRDDGAVRAALATRLGGRLFAELRDQRDDVDAWQRDAALFEQYDRRWRRRGVLALVQTVAAAAAPRLIAGDDGERALTDLRHLGELLQARSEEIAGREELLNWFADECERAIPEAAEAAADERQQRIESDAARVRLMTLHGAKGLEFDIVVLPLMWTNRHNSYDEIAVVHDRAAHQRLVTFGAEAMRRYKREGQDERFRLLYVALTRARYACHVYALSPERRQGTARKDSDPERAPLDSIVERVLAGAPDDIDYVRWSAGRWPWPDDRYRPPRPPPRAAAHVLALPPAPPFASTWSFSALLQSSGVGAAEEAAAADEEGAAQADEGVAAESADDAGEHAQLAWLAPVAGADFGNALHAVFEQREIGRPFAQQHALIRRCLREHGVGLRGIALDDLVPHLAARVQATLDTPLLPQRDPEFSLGMLPARALCAELPFEFALGEVSLERLRAACDFVPPTSLHALRGMMTGKIDLVFERNGRFHVLDYKSNRLGTRLADYAAERLGQAMARDHYRFQALLYTVAVDRYLRQRGAGYRREHHLGEAIYLFVRAVGIAPVEEPLAGIWMQRFDDDLLDAVDAALAGAAREAA